MLLNNEQRTKLWNFGIYGDSGTGKTSLAVTAPDPVFLLSERQGFESVRAQAERMKKPTPPVFLVQSRDDLGKALKVLQSVRDKPIVALCEAFGDKPENLPYEKPQTVVLDSLSDMMQMIWEHMMVEAPPKNAKDGLPDLLRYWNPMKDRGTNLIRAFRDIPYHTLYLCSKEDKEIGEGDEKTRIVQPQMPMRGMANILAHACNAVGMTRATREFKEGEDMKIRRWVQFAAPDFTMIKPLRPLVDKETPNIGKWIEKLNKQEQETKKADRAAQAEEGASDV